MADWDAPLVDAPAVTLDQTGRGPLYPPVRQSGGISVRVEPRTAPASTLSVDPGAGRGGASREGTVAFWVSKGAPPHVAEGIADRVNVESGFKPTVEGDSGTSIGLYQDHAERKARLQKLPNWQDPMVQHENAYSEVTGGDSIASAHWKEILAAPDRKTASTLWDKYFERSAGSQRGWDAPTRTISAGKWNVSPNAIAFEQGRGSSSVVWMSPDDYLGMVPESTDKDKRKSLLKSLALGDDIEAIPTLDAKVEKGRAMIVDQDGRNRARVAKEEGVDLIPVAVHGLGKDAPAEITDMRGKVRPFDFAPVAKAGARPTLTGMPGLSTDAATAAAAQSNHLGAGAQRAAAEALALPAGAVMGAARPVVGAGQLLAHGAEALGVPGGAAASGAMDTAARGLESAIGGLPSGQPGGMPMPSPQNMAAVGDIAASMAVPASRIASLPRLARPVAAAGLGAATGAVQPVTGPDYWGEVGQNALIGGLTGGGLQGAGEGVNALANLGRRFVSKGTLTAAASRLVGLGGKTKITDNELHGMFRSVGRSMDILENRASLDFSDPTLMRALDAAKNAARSLGTDGAPVVAAVNDIKTRFAVHNGLMPGKVAAAFWHDGSSIDRLTKRANPDLRNLAQDVKSALRDAMARRMPPDEAAMYSQLRSRYRDLKIVSKARVADEVNPGKLIRETEKRFPRDRPIPDALKPQVLKVAQAAERAFTPREGMFGPRHVAGMMTGGMLGSMLGGPIGTGIGSVTGHFLADALMRARYAPKNAINALRPPRPPNNAMLSIGQFAPPAATAATMIPGAVQ